MKDDGEMDRGGGLPTYTVGLLLLIYALSFIDRQIVNILAEPIKADLKLTDSQLGMLTGLAFALLYTSAGLPIARLAERFNRSWLISASLFLWSGFTAACGLAQSFWQLLLCRVGVGLGEAGCSPSAQTLITDLTPPAAHGRALSIYAMGAPIGSMLGMVIGGFVVQISGWRAAFLIVGLPGLLVALVTLLTLREPRRSAARAAAASIPPVRVALHDLLRTRSFIWLSLGAGTTSFVAYGQQAFYGSFFLRNHGPEIEQLAGAAGTQPIAFLGTALGVILGVAGALGSFLGGTLADRYTRNGLAAYATVPAVAAALSMPLFALAFLTPSASLSLLLLVAPASLTYVWLGPVFAGVQRVVHPGSRATAVAMLLLILNAIGLGLGPTLVGLASEVLTPSHGQAAALRWALTGATSVCLLSAFCFWRAAAHMRAPVAAIPST